MFQKATLQQKVGRVTGDCRHRRRRGSTTLELAIVLPLLLTTALLAVDYGRFASTYIAVTNAARAGAYYGSFHPVGNKAAWDAAIRQAVEDELDVQNSTKFNAADLSMAEPIVVDEGGGMRRVTVDVSYPFRTVVNWPFLPGYNDDLMLRRVVVMRGIR
jgi:Flp pilus assembly protein TadG